MPDDAMWVQFAEAEIIPGEPCPCGGRVLDRVHLQYVRCKTCGSLLLLTRAGGDGWIGDDDDDDDVDDDEPLDGEPSAANRAKTRAERQLERRTRRAQEWITLRDFTNVHLALYEDLETRKRFFGYGVDGEGRTVLLLVLVPLQEGAVIPDPDSPLGCSHKVSPWHPEVADEVIDFKPWRDRPDSAWDVVLP
jgi:hypothetical protein